MQIADWCSHPEKLKISSSLKFAFQFDLKTIFLVCSTITSITIFSYFSAITNSYNIYLSGDQINTFANPEIHDYLSNGRWVTDLWLSVVSRLPLPSLSWLFVILCNCFSVLMLCKLWEVHSTFLVIIISAFFATNFTLTLVLAWWHQFPTHQFGITTAIAAVYLPFIAESSLLGILLGSLFAMLSLASYQPHISIIITLIFAGVLLMSIDNKIFSLKNYLSHKLLPQIVTLFFGVLLYFSSLKFITLVGWGSSERLNGQIISSPTALFNKINVTYQFIISRFHQNLDHNLNFGLWKFYDGPFWYCVAALLIIELYTIVSISKKNKSSVGLLIIVTTFIAMIFSSYIHVYMINDMIYSQWEGRSSGGLMILSISSIAITYKSSKKLKRTISYISIFLILIMSYKALIYSESIKLQSMRQLARYQILATQIISLPGFKSGMTITPVFNNTNSMNWNHTISYAYAMKKIFNLPVKISTKKNSERFEKTYDKWGGGLGVWPEANSITILEDNVLFVMGTPGAKGLSFNVHGSPQQ